MTAEPETSRKNGMCSLQYPLASLGFARLIQLHGLLERFFGDGGLCERYSKGVTYCVIEGIHLYLSQKDWKVCREDGVISSTNTEYRAHRQVRCSPQQTNLSLN